MKILLVVPRYVEKVGQYYIFPLGLAYVSGALKQAGHEVHCLNLNHREDAVETEVEKAVREIGPDAMGTGTLSVHYPLMKPLLAAARRAKPDIINFIGNGAVTSEPELILSSTEADIGVLGEGEVTVVELIAALEEGRDLAGVEGIAFKDGKGGITKTEGRKSSRELDDLAWPDYQGFEFEQHLELQKTTDDYFFNITDNPRAIEIISSRSCPFPCTFCFQPMGKVYRERSLDGFFAELDHLIGQFGVTMISILDELFAVKRERLEEFCQRIRAYDIKWMVQLRVDLMDQEILDLMKDAGCAYISYGLESMSETVLESMKKKANREQVERALEMTYKAKIGIQGNFIFGDPAETIETANETLDWWASNRRYQIFLCAVQCYPGTGIYRDAVERGIIADRLKFHEQGCPDLNITHLDEAVYSKLVNKISMLNNTLLFPAKPISVERNPEPDPYRGDTLRIRCECPHCDEENDYKEVPVDVMPFGRTTFRLTCRSCNQRFDLPVSLSSQAFPEAVNAQMAAARQAHQQGDLQQAYQLYFQVARAVPDHLEALGALASILLGAGKAEDALFFIERALVVNPTAARSHVAYADILNMTGDWGGAKLHYQQAAMLDPGDAEAAVKLENVSALLATREGPIQYVAAE